MVKPTIMPSAPAAETASAVPVCVAWLPHRQRRKARPGRAAVPACAVAISTTSGHPQPRAGTGPGRVAGPGRLAGPERVAGPEWLAGRGGGTGARRGHELLASRVHSELTPELLGLRHVPGLGEPPGAERSGRVGHRTYIAHPCAGDLKAPTADGTDQVVVRPVGHDGHEVQAHRLLRPDVVEEHLVMTVRAHAGRDLAQIVGMAWPEAENHHTAIQAEVPAQRFIPSR